MSLNRLCYKKTYHHKNSHHNSHGICLFKQDSQISSHYEFFNNFILLKTVSFMLFFVDKPRWYTSFDIVRKVKRLYRNTPRVKVGHAWTLDPLATWLLIVWVWKWTKKLHELVWLDKQYHATIDLSQRSDTRDTDYWKRHANTETIELSLDEAQKRWRQCFNKTIPTQQQLTAFLRTLQGNPTLLLTPFSAKKVAWKKLYTYARAGEPILKEQSMEIKKITLRNYAFPLLTIACHVWSWTYIRSIAQTIWNHFWRWWIITQLKRTAIWKYSLDDCTKLFPL